MKWRLQMAVAILLLASPGLGQAGGFGAFQKEPINAPGSYKLIADPTGQAPSPKVHSFTIAPGKCSASAYDNGNSDCTFKSVRSQLYEPNKQQPKEAWYGWSMYLPADFPVGRRQAATGLYSFAYWHNGECPHAAFVSDTGTSSKLYLQTNTMPPGGKYPCVPDKRITIGDLGALRGKWHRFEVHAKWDAGADGMMEVFLDGAQVAALRGRTLTQGGPNKNYFKFGIYLCCTKGVELVTPATVLYTDVARAATREGL